MIKSSDSRSDEKITSQKIVEISNLISHNEHSSKSLNETLNKSDLELKEIISELIPPELELSGIEKLLANENAEEHYGIIPEQQEKGSPNKSEKSKIEESNEKKNDTESQLENLTENLQKNKRTKISPKSNRPVTRKRRRECGESIISPDSKKPRQWPFAKKVLPKNYGKSSELKKLISSPEKEENPAMEIEEVDKLVTTDKCQDTNTDKIENLTTPQKSVMEDFQNATPQINEFLNFDIETLYFESPGIIFHKKRDPCSKSASKTTESNSLFCNTSGILFKLSEFDSKDVPFSRSLDFFRNSDEDIEKQSDIPMESEEILNILENMENNRVEDNKPEIANTSDSENPTGSDDAIFEKKNDSVMMDCDFTSPNQKSSTPVTDIENSNLNEVSKEIIAESEPEKTMDEGKVESGGSSIPTLKDIALKTSVNRLVAQLNLLQNRLNTQKQAASKLNETENNLDVNCFQKEDINKEFANIEMTDVTRKPEILDIGIENNLQAEKSVENIKNEENSTSDSESKCELREVITETPIVISENNCEIETVKNINSNESIDEIENEITIRIEYQESAEKVLVDLKDSNEKSRAVEEKSINLEAQISEINGNTASDIKQKEKSKICDNENNFNKCQVSFEDHSEPINKEIQTSSEAEDTKNLENLTETEETTLEKTTKAPKTDNSNATYENSFACDKSEVENGTKSDEKTSIELNQPDLVSQPEIDFSPVINDEKTDLKISEKMEIDESESVSQASDSLHPSEMTPETVSSLEYVEKDEEMEVGPPAEEPIIQIPNIIIENVDSNSVFDNEQNYPLKIEVLDNNHLFETEKMDTYLEAPTHTEQIPEEINSDQGQLTIENLKDMEISESPEESEKIEEVKQTDILKSEINQNLQEEFDKRKSTEAVLENEEGSDEEIEFLIQMEDSESEDEGKIYQEIPENFRDIEIKKEPEELLENIKEDAESDESDLDDDEVLIEMIDFEDEEIENLKGTSQQTNELCPDNKSVEKTLITQDKGEEENLPDEFEVMIYEETDESDKEEIEQENDTIGKNQLHLIRDKLNLSENSQILQNLSIASKTVDGRMPDENDKKIFETCSQKCEKCLHKFNSFRDVKQHYLATHKIEGYLTCCQRKFSKRDLLVSHLAKMHSVSFKQFFSIIKTFI